MLLKGLLAASFAGWIAWASQASPPAPPAPIKAPTIARISGPHTHGNLTVFLLHGADTLPKSQFLTLQEALDQKKIVVHETSNVNQLAVENVATDVEVFLMTGDIVKGGKQDRAIAFDMVIPPKSGQVPIGSFCVESGRWRQRGAETSAMFSGSANQVVGKDLKNAISRDNDQGRVWEEVKKAQDKLARNTGGQVQDAASPSSLQLALENKKVAERIEAYEKALAKAADGTDVIGVAFAVNGELAGAEVYGSSALCARLWPKLLKSAATEALADFDAKKKYEPATVKAVESFMAEALASPAKDVALVANSNTGRSSNTVNSNRAAQQLENVAPQQSQQRAAVDSQGEQPASPVGTLARVKIVRYDGKKAMCVECRDQTRPGLVIHRSFIAK